MLAARKVAALRESFFGVEEKPLQANRVFRAGARSKVALVCGDAAQATNYLLQVKLRNGSALTRGLFGHCRSKVSRAAALHRTSKMLPMSFRGSDCFPSAARAVRNRALIAAGHLWFAVCDVWETATRNQRRLLRTPVDGTTCREGCGAVLCGVCPGTKHRVSLALWYVAKAATNCPPECGKDFGG